MKIGINSLVSRVLCRHHNAELSSLDESGRGFLQALKTSFNDAISNGEFTHEVFYLEGDRIELWLLKILCGVLASSKNVEVPGKWMEILFKREPLPDGWGLHVFGEPGSSTWFFNLVRVISVQDKNGNIAGAKFGIGGLAFLLAFGKPIFSESKIHSIYRPDNIIVEKDAKTKEINFSWGRYIGGGSVRLDIAGLIEDGDSIHRPIVRPCRKDKR